MKRSALLLLVLLFWQAGLAGPESLRIGTWNLRNYLTQNRWEDGQFRMEYPKPEREKAGIRHLLLQVHADVLFLQEIGSEPFLRELQEDLAAAGLEYPFRHLSIRDGSRSGLAILARIEPEEILFHDPADPGTGEAVVQRGIQEVLFRHGAVELRVFHVHLKSRYTTDKADPESARFRARELGLLREMTRERLGLAGNAETLLLAGDFNALFDSEMTAGLRAEWAPLTVLDAEDADWTYHHFKTGRRERIDGFWHPLARGEAILPVAVYPLTKELPGGSDHRMVLVDWNPTAPTTPRQGLPENP